jgi:glycosyltransferase involved in cell wall biosynthesis
MTRRLLVLAYFYPPLAGGGVHRVLSFTRHLPQHGWECTVVCAGAADSWIRDDTLAARVPAATEVIRVPGGSGLAWWQRLRAGRAVDRRPSAAFAALRGVADWIAFPDTYAAWARRARAAAAARIARGGVDAILSSSPPDSAHLAARELARESGLPWVADFRDPWIALHFRTPPTPWHRASHERAERSVLGSADQVLAASRTHSEAIAALRRADGAPLAHGLVHLPNGFEPDTEVNAGIAAADDVHFHAVFTGTLALMDDVHTLLEALHLLLLRNPDARSRLRVTLAGPHESEYPARAEALGLTDVVGFKGAIEHGAARALQRSADLLLLWKPRGAGYRTMVPGKLYEYLDSGRPLLAVLPAGDEAAALVESAGGTRVMPGDASTLADVLEHAFEQWCAGGRTPGHRPAWLEEHTRARLAARLAATLDAMVKGRP